MHWWKEISVHFYGYPWKVWTWPLWKRSKNEYYYIYAQLDEERWQLTEESRAALIRRVQRRFGLSKANAAGSVSTAYVRNKEDAIAYIQREFKNGSWLSLEENRETLIYLIQRHFGLGKDLSEATATYFVNAALSLHEK